MSVQLLSSEDLEEILVKLHNCLSSLPTTIPIGNQHYNFQFFGPDPDKVVDIGVDGAINHALEVIFCPGGRANGITFVERGPGLAAIADVLRKYNNEYPKHAILQKWVWDLLHSGVKAGGVTGPQYTLVDSDTEDTADGTDKRKKISNWKPPGKKAKLEPRSKLDKYVDLDPSSEEKGKGGRPSDPFLAKLRVLCYLKNDPAQKRHYRCSGAINGCDRNWVKKSGYRDRVLIHASKCRFLPSQVRRDANRHFGREALGKFFEDAGGSGSDVEIEAMDTVRDDVTDVMEPISTAGSVISRDSSLLDLAKKAGRTELNKKINFAILKVICVRGIPPTIVDSAEWKELMTTAAPSYQPPGSKMFVDSLFPREHSFIKEKQMDHLKKCNNLTISFDGGTTAAQQSVYTVHVITPQRRIFLIEGSEASRESHTGEHIFGVLNAVILSIGPEHFRGITSDNTGNTTVARRRIQETYPWMIILPDPCHRLNLLCKDIGNIDHFKQVIKQVQRVVQFFRKSTHASSNLKAKRKELGINRGIILIGKTRFSSVYQAADSITKNYPAISQLCQQEIISIPEVNNLFIPGLASSRFLFALQQFTTVLAPIAKSITCLESSHSTVADIYFFWLAVTAKIYYMLSEDGLPNCVQEEIRSAVNFRFDQMVNDAPSDVFVTGFVLDPRFRKANIFRDLNPLVLQKLKIPARDATGKLSTASTGTSEGQTPVTLRRAGNFLLSLLRVQYKRLEEPIAGLRLAEAFTRLQEQVIKYQKNVYPFERPLQGNEMPGDWWARLDRDQSNDAQPLAFLARGIFELLPNSMADERTASTFTWLNSPVRNRQEVQTLVCMTTIRQWYSYNPNIPTEPFRPTVRFVDMKDILAGDKKLKRPSSGAIAKPASLDVTPAMEPGASDDFGNDMDDINLDGEDGIEEYEGSAGQRKTKDIQSFDLEDHVNFSAPALRDLLSEKGLVGSPNAYELVLDKPEATKDNWNDTAIDLDDDDLWKMA